jgi:hypothetical protein
VASSESSHVLCRTIVFIPFMKMRDVYSSMARFESPTNGRYLMTMQWSASQRDWAAHEYHPSKRTGLGVPFHIYAKR